MFYAFRFMRAASRLGIEFSGVNENILLEYGLSNKKFGLNPTESAVSAYRLFMPDVIKNNPNAGLEIIQTTTPLIMSWVHRGKVRMEEAEAALLAVNSAVKNN
jgi:hypothetical protein